MVPFKHSRMIGKILNSLTVIEEEKSRWPKWEIEIKSMQRLRALTITFIANYIGYVFLLC